MATVASSSAHLVEAGPGCARRALARLFFGMTGPRGAVTDAEWEAFLLQVVTPRFPGGLTVVDANGHWRPPGETLRREPSRVLELVYDESPDAHRLIAQIVAIYKGRFQQDSVMVMRTPAHVCF